MADLVSGDALMGAGTVLAAVAILGGIRWLAAAKAKQIDGLPDKLHAMDLALVKLDARMAKAEGDIANDKDGRRAFAAAKEELAAMRATLVLTQQSITELWSQVNKVRGQGNKEAA